MDNIAHVVVIDQDGVVDRYGSVEEAKIDYPEAIEVERNDERPDAEFRIMEYTEAEAREIEQAFVPY